nr:BRO family protein [Xylella fastidiosa]
MNAPSEFTLQFESHAVRVQVDEAGTPWFNANDICTAVELLNPCAALAQHVGARNVSKRKIIDTIGRTQRANYLNEPGMLTLLIGSTKEAAKRLRRWLISEALPAAAVQKAGQHSVPQHHAPSVSTPFQPTEDHTMNAITPFQFESHAVRTVVDDHGEVWFVGKDVADVLGYTNHNKALGDHCRGVTKCYPILDSLGRSRETRIISEPDMLRLIVSSKLPAAERFERWVFEELLPTLRKTGNRPALDHSTHSANAITPFQFESKDVRIQLDEASAPWFNANDVCAVLEFGNPHQAIESHVDADDLQKLEVIDALGRTQRANHINESGLYALIMGSTKPAAKRFKRWVTSEVLPTLRKTGTYSTPGALPTLPGPTQDRIAALLLIGQYISTVPGVKPGIAAAATLACIKSNTNLTTEEIRRVLPALQEPLCMLNATQLGKQLHCSAKEANQLLASAGLQFRNERDDWELTEAGRVWGEAIPYSRNGHSSYQILWNPTVVDSLKVAA